MVQDENLEYLRYRHLPCETKHFAEIFETDTM